jgi:hypothetical protein
MSDMWLGRWGELNPEDKEAMARMSKRRSNGGEMVRKYMGNVRLGRAKSC